MAMGVVCEAAHVGTSSDTALPGIVGRSAKQSCAGCNDDQIGPTMDLLTAMRMFRMVAEGHSLSAIGRQSGKAASTVSRRIQALEAHLGVRLIQRTTRDVQLTATGAEYLDRIAPILDELDATHQMLAEQQAVPRGLLRLTAP